MALKSTIALVLLLVVFRLLQPPAPQMKRVTWPSWKQVRATTGVVIVAVFAFAANFALVDTLVSEGLKRLMNVFSR